MYAEIEGYNLGVSSSKGKTSSIRGLPYALGAFPDSWIYDPGVGTGDGAKTEEAVALVMGEVHSGSPLVRIHSQCLTGRRVWLAALRLPPAT
jgi:GTP cyclohydrolase II